MVSKWGGAAAGAGTGALAGSAFGPIGTGIGGLLGGALGYFGTEPDEYKQLSTQTPQQQEVLNQLLSHLKSMQAPGSAYSGAQNYLQSMLNKDPSILQNFAAPYMQQFEQQTVPMLAERFAGLGGGLGGGALGSSGFGQAVGGAGAQLQSQLAHLFEQMRGNAASTAMNQYGNLANLGLSQRSFENTYQPGSSAVGPMAAGLGQGVGQGVGMGLGKKFGEWFS